jgi:hypothetical protein
MPDPSLPPESPSPGGLPDMAQMDRVLQVLRESLTWAERLIREVKSLIKPGEKLTPEVLAAVMARMPRGRIDLIHRMHRRQWHPAEWAGLRYSRHRRGCEPVRLHGRTGER